jgi:Holliday junction resolvase RusA-like endonuclease
MSPKPETAPFRLRLTLPLPPAGVNHAYMNVVRKAVSGKRYSARKLTPAAEFWRDCAADMAIEAMSKAGLKLIEREKFSVDMVIWFRDKRSQVDGDGIQKLPLDALKKIVYSDDKFALPRVLDYHFDATEPRIEMTISCPPTSLVELSS